MHHFRAVFLAFSAVILMTGCSVMAPPYSASIANVQKLKDAGTQMTKVGDFASSKDQGNANPISIRGSSMKSPYQVKRRAIN